MSFWNISRNTIENKRFQLPKQLSSLLIPKYLHRSSIYFALHVNIDRTS